MEKIRQIIHLDLDAFFCAVEEQRQPRLRGRPFAVGGSPQGRGVVSSCSYPARRFGVHSAMPMAQAIRLCPELEVVSSHYSDYQKASHQVMAFLHALTPQVEQISIDEAFLDVSDIPDGIETCAQKLGNQVRDELKLPCSLGGATNKLVAKIATDVGKAAAKGSGPPNAITIVPPGSEAAFLAPLPVRMLWGVGKKTAARLEKLSIHTIGELAEHPELELIKAFGKNGWEISQRAQGVDRRGIVTSRPAKSISQERTFPQDVYSEKVLNDTLQSQSKRVAKRLKKNNMRGKTVKIKLRWPDFTTLTRQTTLNQPTDESGEIYKAAQKLLKSEWNPGRGVRLLGVGVSGLDKTRQLGLWDKDLQKERQLQDAIDALEAKFGAGVLWRGQHETPEERHR